jgi:hypothetical protein
MKEKDAGERMKDEIQKSEAEKKRMKPPLIVYY